MTLQNHITGSYYGIILRNDIMELYYGITFMKSIPRMLGTSLEPPGIPWARPWEPQGRPWDPWGTSLRPTGTPLGCLGTPLEPRGTSLRPPRDVPETPGDAPGSTGDHLQPVMDHKNGHISTSIQRQKLSIAELEAASWDPLHEALHRAVLFIKQLPKSKNRGWGDGPWRCGAKLRLKPKR